MTTLLSIILLVLMFPTLYAIFGLLGRCFVDIGTNEVGGVFLFRRRLYYVVGYQEDYDKLMIPPPAYSTLTSPNTGKVRFVFDPTPFGILGRFTNFRMYSWNPLASFRLLEIIPRKPKEAAATQGQNDRAPRLRDSIDIPAQSRMERFLRIDSSQIGLDEEVELEDKQTRVNYIRESKIRAWDLDEIWLPQGGKFSMFSNQTLKGGHTNYFKTLDYDEYKAGDFSEASTDFDHQIQSRISGANGILVVSTHINDYELGSGQEALIKAQIEDQAAEFVASKTRKEQQGIADGKLAVGKAEAKAIHLRMAARFLRGKRAAGMSPNVVVLADALESGLSALFKARS